MTDPSFWPTDHRLAEQLARRTFVAEYVAASRHWSRWGADLVRNPEPGAPYRRPWNQAAAEDREFRAAFSGLDERAKDAVVRLLERCVSGAVYSALMAIDQFPLGEAELFVVERVDGVLDADRRRFKVAPGDSGLHDDFGSMLDADEA